MIRMAAIVACCGLTACGTITDFRNMATSAVGPTPAPTPAVAPVMPTPAPQPTVLTAKERLMAAIDGQGCELNATNVGAILTAAVITREELLQLTPQLQSEGRVAVSGSGSIRSTSSTCINA